MRAVTHRWRIRELRPDDSFEELTALLHRAYAPLAERGLLYLATHQDVETTRRRTAKGTCFVAEDVDAGTLVGTIVVVPPATSLDHGHASGAAGPDWYDEPGVAKFGQYGVDPMWKGLGLGRALHAVAEGHARTLGATELACDTAEPATDLLEMYQRWGYRVVGTTQWELTNYRSVVLSKRLVEPASTVSSPPASPDASATARDAGATPSDSGTAARDAGAESNA